MIDNVTDEDFETVPLTHPDAELIWAYFFDKEKNAGAAYAALAQIRRAGAIEGMRALILSRGRP